MLFLVFLAFSIDFYGLFVDLVSASRFVNEEVGLNVVSFI